MTQLEKSVLARGFALMTEDELYEVNGGRWFGRDESDKPKREKKEKSTPIHHDKPTVDISTPTKDKRGVPNGKKSIEITGSPSRDSQENQNGWKSGIKIRIGG